MKTMMAVLLIVLSAGATSLAYGQRAIFVLRHGERAEYESKDGLLSAAGEARAKALANLLRDAGVTAIYVSDRRRTTQTADPLAKELKLTPVPIGGRAEESVNQLMRKLQTHDKNAIVAIIGHQNTVPMILRALGHQEEVKIGDYEHDDLFVVVPKDAGPPTVLRLNY